MELDPRKTTVQDWVDSHPDIQLDQLPMESRDALITDVCSDWAEREKLSEIELTVLGRISLNHLDSWIRRGSLETLRKHAPLEAAIVSYALTLEFDPDIQSLGVYSLSKYSENLATDRYLSLTVDEPNGTVANHSNFKPRETTPAVGENDHLISRNGALISVIFCEQDTETKLMALESLMKSGQPESIKTIVLGAACYNRNQEIKQAAQNHLSELGELGRNVFRAMSSGYLESMVQTKTNQS